MTTDIPQNLKEIDLEIRSTLQELGRAGGWDGDDTSGQEAARDLMRRLELLKAAREVHLKVAAPLESDSDYGSESETAIRPPSDDDDIDWDALEEAESLADKRRQIKPVSPLPPH